MNKEAIEFVKEQVFGWIGNLMRDAEAKGYPLDPTDIASALEQVAWMVDARPTNEEFNEFLEELNDGRGRE